MSGEPGHVESGHLDSGYGDGTRCVRAGLPAPVPGQAFLPGPVLASTYPLDPETGPVPGVDGTPQIEIMPKKVNRPLMCSESK